jgi:hypothetical protein
VSIASLWVHYRAVICPISQIQLSTNVGELDRTVLAGLLRCTSGANGDRPVSLAVERERWAVTARCERGCTELLPDLAVWLDRSAPPVAVIAESGGRREDRQKMILEGWHNGILSGRYTGDEQVQILTARAMLPPPVPEKLPEPPPEPQPETPEAVAERQRQYREIFGLEDPFGIDEPARRRRWRR